MRLFTEIQCVTMEIPINAMQIAIMQSAASGGRKSGPENRENLKKQQPWRDPCGALFPVSLVWPHPSHHKKYEKVKEEGKRKKGLVTLNRMLQLPPTFRQRKSDCSRHITV